MSTFAIPFLGSTKDDLNSYCNFIEYSCYRDGEMLFNEFDLSDLKLRDVSTELERRLSLYGTFAPFKILRDRVSSLISPKADNLAYVYCLYYSIKGGAAPANTVLFEHITDNCLKNYFGTQFSHITSVGQNSANLLNTIETLRVNIREDKGNYQHLSTQAKDGGIDIVTYKPLDERGNQIICLTDATIGRNWRSEKKVGNKLRFWNQWINFKVTPITCLSIVHIVEDNFFHSASTENGLIFDRARVLQYYKSDPTIEKNLITWLKGL